MYDGKQQNYKISSKELEFNLSGKSKITIQDSANIRADETITIQKNAESAITFTAKANGASGTQFNIHASASTTATNLATAINGHSDFTASATGNVVTIAVTGGGTVTVVSNDEHRLDPTKEVVAWGASDGGPNDWDGDGDYDPADLVLAEALFDKFATVSNPRITQVTVEDTRPGSAGDGKDTLYGIEKLSFKEGVMDWKDVLLLPEIFRDHNGKIHFMKGTEFGDLFKGDDNNNDIESMGGDDDIVAGNELTELPQVLELITYMVD